MTEIAGWVSPKYALDVHKDSVFMCIIDEFGFKKEHKFSTLTSDLLLFA